MSHRQKSLGVAAKQFPMMAPARMMSCSRSYSTSGLAGLGTVRRGPVPGRRRASWPANPASTCAQTRDQHANKRPERRRISEDKALRETGEVTTCHAGWPHGWRKHLAVRHSWRTCQSVSIGANDVPRARGRWPADQQPVQLIHIKAQTAPALLPRRAATPTRHAMTRAESSSEAPTIKVTPYELIGGEAGGSAALRHVRPSPLCDRRRRA
jgi:hypothetical protein